MKKQFLVVTGWMALAFGPLAVWADQCAYVTEEQAQAAAESLPVGGKFVPFCEPCGDEQFPAGEPQVVESSVVHALPVSETGLGQDYWELQLNGEGVDLAYIYVQQDSGMFINLAKLADCPASGVKAEYDAEGQSSLVLPHLPPSKK